MRHQSQVGAGTTVVGLGLMAGATQISSEAGYTGVGPNFLPWVVAVALTLCGVVLMIEAARGGFRDFEAPPGDERPHWPGFAWVSAGLLANAALITTIGFILSCALCFALAARGFKASEGRPAFDPRGLTLDLALGAAIAAPVYWMFTQLLAINLPGLTSTGWI
ncbi:MAG TPA: tripartite tricarboxylate transporter TctB family protein [Burkholderiaceae bacterium]|nr:tripartite tricarboxylate transporter TctB family protein [Burkholderiaceae bacterium]